MSKKHPKKPQCVCKGKEQRVYPGYDRQKHIARCPLVTGKPRERG